MKNENITIMGVLTGFGYAFLTLFILIGMTWGVLLMGGDTWIELLIGAIMSFGGFGIFLLFTQKTRKRSK